MEIWEQLVSSALLGSERRPLEITDDAPTLLQHLGQDNPENRLLLSAAVMSVYRRAGYCPTTFTSTPVAPALDEIRPTCSVRAGRHLIAILEHMPSYRPLLMEWLVIIDGKGKRVHHPYLPMLLDLARRSRKDKALITQIAAVMGERGRWLAAQNSDWAFLLTPQSLESKPDEKPKHSGSLPEDMDRKIVELLDLEGQWAVSQVKDFIDWAIQTENHLLYLGNFIDIVARFAPETLAPSLHRLQPSTSQNRNGLPALTQVIEFRTKMLEDLSHE